MKTIAIGSFIALSAFLIGGGYGYSAGKSVQIKRDIATVQRFFKEHQQAVVFMTPDRKAAALFQNGVCTPFPASVPQDHRTVWVSPYWTPCSAVTLAPYEHPAHVRAKLAGLA